MPASVQYLRTQDDPILSVCDCEIVVDVRISLWKWKSKSAHSYAMSSRSGLTSRECPESTHKMQQKCSTWEEKKVISLTWFGSAARHRRGRSFASPKQHSNNISTCVATCLWWPNGNSIGGGELRWRLISVQHRHRWNAIFKRTDNQIRTVYPTIAFSVVWCGLYGNVLKNKVKWQGDRTELVVISAGCLFASCCHALFSTTTTTISNQSHTVPVECVVMHIL